MLSSFIRIQTKNKEDAASQPISTPSMIPTIQTTTKKATRRKKLKQAKNDEDIEYSKFVPLKQPKNTVEHFEDDEDDGMFSKVPAEDDHDFEDQNDVYKKQDLEWAEMMKEIDDTMAADDSDMSVSEEAESSHMSTDIDESPYESNFDSPSITESPSFTGYADDDAFYARRSREPKEKPTRIYSGVAISSDDDFIP